MNSISILHFRVASVSCKITGLGIENSHDAELPPLRDVQPGALIKERQGQEAAGDRTAQRTVPVALDGLGIEGAHDAELLAQAVQQPARHHDLVAHVRGAHRADLELPLPGHHLRVDAADQQPGLHARSQGF